MRLTQESPRVRWSIMFGTWVLVALLAAWHSRLVGDYVTLLDSLGRRGAPLTTPLQRVCPSNFMDAQTWTRYAVALQAGAPARVRFTDTDNAPLGREVHWDSGFAHALAAAGRLEQARTGGALPQATERALAWFNLPLLLGLIGLFSAYAAQRAGAGAGVVVALGMFGSHDFYAGFLPTYVDHHGLLSAAVFGVVLGAGFAGGGWWQSGEVAAGRLLPVSRNEARRAMIWSAVCGAVGMWLSAATVIPALVIVGAAAVVATWWHGRASLATDSTSSPLEGAEVDPGLWRLWGRVGAGLSVFFYLLEYAPAHLGWRLEVNHPLYALAWWGGAELMAWWCARCMGTAGVSVGRGVVLPLLALAAAPIAILTGGTKVFVASDPFVARLSDTVAEGLSLVQAVRLIGWHEFWSHCNTPLLPLLPAAFLLVRRRPRGDPLLAFATVAALVFVAMGCWKIRWWLNTGGPLVVLSLVVLAGLVRGRSARWGWLAIGGFAAVCFLPDVFQRIAMVRDMVGQRMIHRADFPQPLYRDIAAVLRTSQPSGEIVLLASPNASTGIGYYGRFKTLGTLYWENTAGLKAAAEIFCARTDDEACALIQARGITHLAMLSDQNYLAEFFALLHPEAPPGDLEKTFGHRLLFQRRLPLWLRPIPYRAPADVPMPNLTVVLLQVVPTQSLPDALWNLGLAQLAFGELAAAEESLQRAIAEAPPTDRTARRFVAGNACYQNGAHAAAVRFLRAARAGTDDPAAARNLAWVLATSTDDSVRNGREALALIQPLVEKFSGDHAFLSLLAATLAENARFPEAIEAATRALALSRAAGDKNGETQNQQRLAAYQAGRPWRQ